MSAKFNSAVVSAVMAACLLATGAASAQMVVGGGSTLSEMLYRDLLPTGINHFEFSYTGTGSGVGKTAFITNNATVFRNESVPSTPAWSASQSVHLVGSDSALTTAEFNTYSANAAGTTGWGPMIQVPAIATAVVIPYKRFNVNNLNLSDAQMCRVFSKRPGGQTWGEILGSSDTTPIRVVYRSDASGTQELLSRYLVSACQGFGFVVSTSFMTMVAGAIPSNIPQPPATPPVVPGDPALALWLPVKGDGGMSAAFSTDGRIGYMSPDAAYGDSSNSAVARINGLLPTAASIRGMLARQALPLGSSTNPLNWVPVYSMPAMGTEYPIFGTSNLLLNQCYKDAAVQARIKTLLTNLTSTTYDALITAHNFAVMPDGTLSGSPPSANSNWKAAIANVFLNSSSPLSIGFPAVCNTRGRPL